MQRKRTLFSVRVVEAVRSIPRGSVLTYKEVARRAGNERAYRAVGNILRKNTNLKIPCHRVIRSNGALGEYNGLKGKKSEILAQEGYSTKL